MLQKKKEIKRATNVKNAVATAAKTARRGKDNVPQLLEKNVVAVDGRVTQGEKKSKVRLWWMLKRAVCGCYS